MICSNTWNVNGWFKLLIGNESLLTSQGDFYTLIPDTVEHLRKGVWFDNTSGILLNQLIKQVGFGSLAKIELNGQGEKIPIDQPFDLD